MRNAVFAYQTQDTLGMIGAFGYTGFAFLSAVKTDISVLRKTGKVTMITGITSALVPLFVILSLQDKLTDMFVKKSQYKLANIGAVHTMTAFPVVSFILDEMKILNSELGRFGLSAALVCDLIGIALMIFYSVMQIYWQKTLQDALLTGGLIFAYVAFVILAVRPATLWVVRNTPEGRPVKNVYVFVCILLMFISVLFTDATFQFDILGPLIFGLFIPAGPPLGSAIIEKLNLFVMEFLLPIFVTNCAIKIDFWNLNLTEGYMVANLILIAVVSVVKLVSSVIPPLIWKIPFKDSLAIGFLLCSKGVVQLCSYTFIRDTQLTGESAYALAVGYVFVLAIIVPVMVKLLYDPARKYVTYQKRNMMFLKPNAELRILACIRRSNNIPAIISLLDAACPTKDNPISVYALHLIELIGRASPILISHQVQKEKSSKKDSYSQKVIEHFSQFEIDNPEAVSLSIYTAISPTKFMNEDICTMALNKITSLIILPFHRRWHVDGTLESEDHSIRNLNCNVLQTSPCSIAILVDRGHLGRTTSLNSPESSYSVAVIFLGGNDDREALTFAKRMVNDPTISLTLIRLVARDEGVVGEWEKVLDMELIKSVKSNSCATNSVIYTEKIVKDGPQTALVLRSLADDYDLFIVGKRHNPEAPQISGLAEWNEFPEIGTIGDLLASSDIYSKASILVIQQQTN